MHTTAAVSESKPVRAAWLAQPSFAKDLFRTALQPGEGGQGGEGGEMRANAGGVFESQAARSWRGNDMRKEGKKAG